jgi:hypothetical protein
MKQEILVVLGRPRATLMNPNSVGQDGDKKKGSLESVTKTFKEVI